MRLDLKRLPPASTLRIKVRPLTQAYRPVALALAQALLKDVVGGGSMVHAPVIPDGDVIGVLPLVAHLQVVVLDNELHEPVEEVLALLLAQAVDALAVVTDGIDGLPAGDGVGADDGVDGLEDLAHVLRSAALAAVHAEAVTLGRLVEERLRVIRSQGVEEGAQGGRDALVELVARGPECVTAGLGKLD